MSFFSKTRLRATQLFQDAFNFLNDQYGQAVEVFTPASPFGQVLTVLANLGEMIFFYIEAAATELNIARARNIESIYGLSRLTGHDPSRGISSRGIIGLRLNTTAASRIEGNYVQINKGTQLQVEQNGLTYFLNFDSDFIRLQKNNRSFVNIEIIQGEIDSQTFTGTGTDIQSYNLTTRDATDQNLVKVTVDGELYENFDSLYDMRSGQKGVLVKTGISGGLSIFFGTEQFGFRPPLGSTIEVEYVKTRGSSGDVGGKGISFKFIDSAQDQFGNDVDLNELLSINVIRNPQFGGDPEDPDFTRLIAPMASKSFVLANPTNYIYFLSRYDFFSFVNAYNTKDDRYLDDDNIVYLFLIPDINRKLTSDVDYFSVDENEFVMTTEEKEQVIDILNESTQQIVTSEVKIVDPIVKKYVLNIVLRYFDNYDKDEINTQIRKNLNDYFLSVRRRDRVPRSDIISIIENVEGVDSVNVFFVSEENEEAIKNGYYTVPVYGTDPVTDQKVLIENKKIVLNEGDDPNLGLDEFGDIKIDENELPIIRGGFTDRNDNYYEEIPKPNTLCSLNVFFKESVVNNLYNKTQQNNFNKLKRNRGTKISTGRGSVSSNTTLKKLRS